MLDEEAKKAIKDKFRVLVGPTNLLDPVGRRECSVLVATGHLVAMKKEKKGNVFLFENAEHETAQGPASMFRPLCRN